MEELGVDPVTLEDLYSKGLDPTIKQTGDLPKYVSSILKKSKNAERYHSQDPITRMISYLDEVAQLVVNKDVVDTLNNARKTQEISKYIGKDVDGVARTIL